MPPKKRVNSKATVNKECSKKSKMSIAKKMKSVKVQIIQIVN